MQTSNTSLNKNSDLNALKFGMIFNCHGKIYLQKIECKKVSLTKVYNSIMAMSMKFVQNFLTNVNRTVSSHWQNYNPLAFPLLLKVPIVCGICLVIGMFTVQYSPPSIFVNTWEQGNL